MKNPRIFRLFATLAFGSLLLSSPLLHAADGPSAKTAKYHEILQKRPSSGYVFDRFYDSWLDQGTSEELETFLTKSATSGKANDQLLLAYYHLRQGKEIEALKLYQRSVKVDPTNSKIRIQKAKLEAQLLNFDGALKDLEAAMEKAGDDEKNDIQQLRGQYLARSGRFKEAQKVWMALLVSQPNDDELIDSILEVQLAEGLFDEALETSSLQIKNTRDPYQKVVFTLRRGDIYQRSGKRKKAIDTYVSTLDSVGENSWLEREILAQLREIYRREDDMEGLKKLYTDLSKTNPQRVGLRKAHAHLLVSLGENDEAEKLFREILKVTPGNRKNREELVSILLKGGKSELALKEVQWLAKTYPKDAALQLKLVAVQHAAGKAADIPVTLNTYLGIKGKSEGAYLVAAGMLKKFNHTDLAVKMLREALKSHPDSDECPDALAHLLIDLKQKDEAITIWKKLVADGSRESVIRYTRSLKQAGEEKLAYQLLVDRAKAYKTDLVFLTYITNEAIVQKDYDNASAWAGTILKLSKHTEEIRLAVQLNASVALKSEKEATLAAALAKNPDRSAVQSWLLAELYELQGQSKESVAVLEKLRVQDANMAAIAEVSLYEHRGDFQKAADAMERILALPKGKKPLHLRRLVEFYNRLDNTEMALKHIETWKQLAPGDKNPWFKQSDLLSATGDREGAIQILRRAAQRFDDDNEFRARLASLYQENEQLGDAERLYWRLYEESKNMNDRMRWVPQLCEIYEARGKTQDLVERFKEKRKTNPKSVEPLLAMAEIYRFNEDYEGRRKSMLEAARLRPNDPEILYAIAQIEEREGDIDRAADTLLKASALDKSEQSKRYLAQFYMRTGEVDKGIELIKSLSAGAKANPRDLEKAAMSIAKGGDIQPALSFLEEALQRHPNDYRLAFLRAIFLVHEEQLELAFDQLAAALKMDRNLPGAKPLMTKAQWEQMFQRNGGFMPKSKMSMIYDSYAVRILAKPNQGNRYGMSTRRGQQPQLYQLPGDLNEKNPLIEGTLLAVVTRMDEDLQKRYFTQLSHLGVKEVEYRLLLVKTMAGGGGRNNFEPLKEYAKNHPDQEGVFVFPVMVEVMQLRYGNYGNSGEKMDTEFLSFAKEKAKKLTPILSFCIEIALIDPDDPKQASQSFKSALGYAGKVKEESIPMASTILSMALTKNKDLDPEVQREAMQLVDKWFWGSYEKSKAGASGFRRALIPNALGILILNDLAKNKDTTAVLAFLEKACAVHAKAQKNGGSSNAYSLMMRRYRNSGSGNTKFSLPVFPPSVFSNDPQWIVQLFIKDPSKRQSYGRNKVEGPDLESLKLDESLDQVTNPYLRIRIAQFAENDAAIATAVDMISKIEPPTLQSIYYQVGFLTQQEKWVEAATTLAKARFLPMRRNQRKTMDEFLTALALEILTSNQKKDDQARLLAIEEGKRAALRLRKSTTTPQERQRLISALDDLGLQSEADRVASTAVAQPSKSRSYSSGGSVKSQIKQIEEALKKEEKDKAQRLALRELKSLIRQPYQYSTGSNQKKLKELLENHDLIDWILQRMDPGESTSVRRRADYALALQLCGKTDKAIKVLDALGSKVKKDDQALLMLAFYLPDDRLDEAGAHLATWIKNHPQQNNQGDLNYYFSGLSDQSIDLYLSGYTVLTEALRQLPADKKFKVNLSWGTRLASDLVINHHSNRVSFPHLGNPDYPKKIKEDKSGNLKKRMTVARAFLEVAITKPELAAWAFPYYQTSFVSMGDEKDLDIEIALVALKNAEEYKAFSAKNQNYNYPSMGGFYGGNRSYQKYEGENPLAYLARQVWLTKDKNLISDAYLKEVGEINQEVATALASMKMLLFISDEKLESEIAKQLLTIQDKDKKNQKKTGNQQTANDSQTQFLITLTDVCVLREHLSKSLEKWMVSKIDPKEQGQWEQRTAMLKQCLSRYIPLLMVKDRSKITPLLDQVMIALIHPDGDIVDFVQAHSKKDEAQNYNYSSSNPSERVKNATRFLTGLMSDKERSGSFYTARCMINTGIDPSLGVRVAANHIGNFRPKTLKEALDVFDKAGFGAMETPTELVMYSSKVAKTSLFQVFVERLGRRITDSNSSSSYLLLKEVNKELPSLTKQQQFFVKLAIISKFPSKQKNKKLLLEILTDHGKTIKKWDADMTAWFSDKIVFNALYHQKSKSIVIPKDYPKSARIMLGSFEKSAIASRARQLDEMLLVKEIKDSNHQNSLESYVSKNSRGLMQLDRPKFIKVVTHIIHLMSQWRDEQFEKQSYNNPFIRSYYSSNYNSMYRDIMRVIPSGKPTEKVALLNELIEADPSSFKNIPSSAMDSIVDDLANKYSTLRYKDRKEKDYVKALDGVIKSFEGLPKAQQQLGALVLCHFILDKVSISHKQQKFCLGYVEKLAKTNPSIIKTALCAGYGANIPEHTPPAWGAAAADHVIQLYAQLPDVRNRVVLSWILAKEGGEMFCNSQIADGATEAIAASLADMDTVERYHAYVTLHAITFQKASTTHQDVYLSLFNQLEKQIKEAKKSQDSSYSSSSPRSYSSSKLLSHIAQSLFGLALRSGDETSIRRVMLRYKKDLVGNPYAVSLALRYGKIDVAEKLWRNVKLKSGSSLVLDPKQAPMGLYDRTMEASLEAFAKRLPKDKDRKLMRDLYMLRASTFDKATKPTTTHLERSKIILGKNLKEADYDFGSVLIFIDQILNSSRYSKDEILDDAMTQALVEQTPAWMKKIREETKDDLQENWKKEYYLIVSLYFKKLVEDDNLEEFLQVNSDLKKAADKADHRMGTGHMVEAALVLQTKIFDAIEAGEMKKIQHYRKFIDPIATNAVQNPNYHYIRDWALPVPLLGICYAYSDHPEDFLKYVQAQHQTRTDLDKYQYLTEYYTFTPLKHAVYHGKPFADKVNRGIRIKIFKQIITASNAGMFNYASVFKKDGTSLSGYVKKYGRFLTDDDYMELIEFATKLNPLNGNALCLMGLHYQKKVKDYKKAEEYFHRAVAEANKIGEKSQADLGKFMFLEAESIALQGKYAKALKLAKSIPTDRIKPPFTSYLNRDLPKWTKEAAKK